MQPQPIALPEDAALDRFDLRACAPLVLVHLGCLSALAVGVSPAALAVCVLSFVVRMFGITAGYHRYFAHRSYRTGRVLQLALAWLGASAAQLGPLWWAGHHRLHHRHTDTALDPHSPRVRGRWWAHMGWLLCRRHAETPLHCVRDLAAFPELRLLDRWHALAPLSLILLLYAVGGACERLAPELHTSGLQLVTWGFFVSTVLLYHATFSVNSLAHTRDSDVSGSTSRNLPWLAVVTLGDGWHANHHHHPASARHGLRAWEVDPCWAVLRLLERVGWARDLRTAQPPGRHRASRAATTAPAQQKANRSPTLP
jgi:stearoyl-CoA desaturase (delta-9 desaturase)